MIFVTQRNRTLFTGFQMAARLVKLGFWLLMAALTIALFAGKSGSLSPITRHMIGFIYRRFYHAANIKVITHGTPTQTPALWVCNHVSWLDVLILAGNSPIDFIAKSEVGEWPFIGPLVRKAGTVLIDRENKFQAYRSLPVLQERIRSGTSVVVFPEGTTTSGHYPLPFKPMFYQAAVRESFLVQPVSLRYETPEGDISEAVAFVGDDEFFDSLLRVVREPNTRVHVHYLPAMTAEEWHRKELASINRRHIGQAIQAA